MPTLQHAQELLRLMSEGGASCYLDLLERSGLRPERYKLALRYLESVGKVQIEVLPSGRWQVCLADTDGRGLSQ
jgi:hypothetical protein